MKIKEAMEKGQLVLHPSNENLRLREMLPEHWSKHGPELLDVLSELQELVDAAAAGEYQIDSFTAQPARLAIASASELLGI